MNYYRRYMADYLSKTASLSMLEHGAYGLLLDYSYLAENGALPGDISEIFRLVRAVKSSEKAAVRKILSTFFRLGNNGYENDRVAKEMDRARPAIEAARQNGLRGGRPKQNPVDNPAGNPLGSIQEPSAKASQPPTTNLLSPNPQPVENTLSGKPDDMKQKVDRVIAHLNAVCGTQFRAGKENYTLVKARLKDYGVDIVERVVDKKFAEWRGTDMVKYLRPSTLFNATKCAQYVGQLDQQLPGGNNGSGKFDPIRAGRELHERHLAEELAAKNVDRGAVSKVQPDLLAEVHGVIPGDKGD